MTDIPIAEQIAACPLCKGRMQFRKALWPSDGCVDAIIHAEPTDCGMAEFSDGSADESILAKWHRVAVVARHEGYDIPLSEQIAAVRDIAEDIDAIAGTSGPFSQESRRKRAA